MLFFHFPVFLSIHPWITELFFSAVWFAWTLFPYTEARKDPVSHIFANIGTCQFTEGRHGFFHFRQDNIGGFPRRKLCHDTLHSLHGASDSVRLSRICQNLSCWRLRGWEKAGDRLSKRVEPCPRSAAD